MQGVAISREKRIRDYFNKHLAELIEEITLSKEPREFNGFPVDRVQELRGAVAYAFAMGDIEQPYKRYLTDSLNDLYRDAMHQHNTPDEFRGK